MITHLFFDLDGTLLDSLPGIEYSARVALAEVLPDRELPDFRPFIGPPIQEIYRRALGETRSGVLGLLEQAYRRSYDSAGWEHTKCYPGVTKVLSELVADGYACLVLTNKPRVPTLKILERLELSRYFMAVITPDARQPRFASKAEAAAETCREFGLTGAQAVLVGDSPEDAAVAQACGFLFAGVTFGYGNVALHGGCPIHFLVDDLSTLPAIIRRCNHQTTPPLIP